MARNVVAFNAAAMNPGYPGGPTTGGWQMFRFRDHEVKTQCTDDSRRLISELASQLSRGAVIGEIGVFGGATLLSLHDLAREKNLRLVGIDPFETISLFNGVTVDQISEETEKGTRNIYRQNRETLQRIVEQEKLGFIIQVFPIGSGEAKDLFPDHTFDLLHIDGDHSADGVYADLLNYWPKMRPGGVIVGDDYPWPSVRAGLKRFCDDHPGLKFEAKGQKFIIRVPLQ